MSEVKISLLFEPLPESMRKSPLVFVTRWRIPQANHDKMVEIATEGMDIQRMHPDKVAYSKTRHWYRPDEDGKTEEWWFMDEYDSAEAFEAMQKMVMPYFTGPGAEELRARHQQFHQQLLNLTIPGTTLEPILYSEIESARIEFEPYKIRAAALERTAAVAQKTQKK